MSGGYDSAKTADEIREGNVEALIEGVLTDNKATANALLAAERADLPEDAPLRQMLERAETTHMLRSARKNGHVSSMNAATGLSEQRIEATGYDRLLSEFKPAAQQVVIRGSKGSGKTGTVSECIRWLVVEGDIDRVATNVPLRGMTREDLERADSIDSLPDEWLDPDRNDELGDLEGVVEFRCTISGFLQFSNEPGEKVMLFDEFSTVGNAYTNQGDVEQVLGRVINAFRKSPGGSTRTVFIGHENDSDIHPMVRKQSNAVVSKDGKASEGQADLATVYSSWDDYLAGDHAYKVRGVRDVPESSPFRYPTNYFAHLEWDLDNPDQQLEHGRLRDDWEEFQDDDDADDPAESGEEAAEYRQCRGTKTDGSECGATVKHVSGFCHAHRSQWDGEEDPRLTDTDTDARGSSAADGAAAGLSALQAATGDADASQDDVELIAAALQSEHPEDLDDAEAERMARSLVDSST